MKQITILFVFICALVVNGQTDIKPMNFKLGGKQKANFSYDGVNFTIYPIDDAKYTVKREYLLRNQHLSLSEREKSDFKDSIFVLERLFVRSIKNKEDNGINRKDYQLETVYNGFRYFFNWSDLKSKAEFFNVSKNLASNLTFYGDIYFETPLFVDQTYLNKRAKDLRQEKLLDYVLTQPELEDLVFDEEFTNEESDAYYVEYFNSVTSNIKYFYNELEKNLTLELISAESILTVESVNSFNYKRKLEANELITQIAYKAMLDGRKFNLGLILMGGLKPKLLNLSFEEFE